MLQCVAVAELTGASERSSFSVHPWLSVVPKPRSHSRFAASGGSRRGHAVWEPFRFRWPLSAGTVCRDAEPSEESFRGAQTPSLCQRTAGEEEPRTPAMPKLDGTFCREWNLKLLTQSDRFGGETSQGCPIPILKLCCSESMDSHRHLDESNPHGCHSVAVIAACPR
jgi:hypothetical protein